jgi:hypothetical protein
MVFKKHSSLHRSGSNHHPASAGTSGNSSPTSNLGSFPNHQLKDHKPRRMPFTDHNSSSSPCYLAYLKSGYGTRVHHSYIYNFFAAGFYYMNLQKISFVLQNVLSPEITLKYEQHFLFIHEAIPVCCVTLYQVSEM